MNYGDASYWETKYTEESDTTFEWLEDYHSLKPYIDEIFYFLMQQDNNNKGRITNSITNVFKPNILVVGCGNSEFSECLFKDYLESSVQTNIYNIDTSKTVINQMNSKVQNLSFEDRILKYECMNVKDMQFNTGFFDLIVDKALLDTMLCGENVLLNTALMMNEIQRVLKVNGYYLIISHAEAEFRMPHLHRPHLSFEISMQTLQKEFHSLEEPNIPRQKTSYLYSCKKKPGADSLSQENFPAVYKELERQDILFQDELFEEKNF
jgi:ubiquinone/menaquinone biosynthesis C-methylase UbiE